MSRVWPSGVLVAVTVASTLLATALLVIVEGNLARWALDQRVGQPVATTMAADSLTADPPALRTSVVWQTTRRAAEEIQGAAVALSTATRDALTAARDAVSPAQSCRSRSLASLIPPSCLRS